jgi:3-hydroxymyristoyl/3-hydroxydecanoyl-(acyl carrier protein) dehydratase
MAPSRISIRLFISCKIELIYFFTIINRKAKKIIAPGEVEILRILPQIATKNGNTIHRDACNCASKKIKMLWKGRDILGLSVHALRDRM